MTKLFFIDLETTGTDPNQNGIVQLSGIIEIDQEEKERINLLIHPFETDVIEEEALEINNRTKEEISNFRSPVAIYKNFIDTMLKYIDKYDRLDKFNFVGYNSRFDDDFLRAWFKKCADKYYGSYFFWPPIDVANMAATWFINKRDLFLNFKLMTVAKAIGIQIDESKSHDAMYDIEITKELFNRLIKEQTHVRTNRNNSKHNQRI